ncbi:PaaI family thioesterase [Shimia aestuarii]|uniref:PaaI family thioesterase n=1 Tax=Shimia aestuarii TaxID=254406 RepID=UPI001FB4C21D|nr:PaaI family thioesterase [Shimia aestuarii]
MTDMMEMGKAVLAAQPFSALLGAELTEFEPGRAELRLVLSEEHKQQHGFAHGGVLSYLADNAITYAGGSVLGNVLTQEMKINYTRPAIGEVLIARAEVVSYGKRQAVCRCDVFALREGEELLCAAAQGTILTVETRG